MKSRMVVTLVVITQFLGFATVAQAADLGGKWSGTQDSTTVYCDVPPQSTGPAAVEITQTGDSFTGTWLWVFANPETCIPTTIPSEYLLDIAGTVDGDTFQADVSFPGEGQIGTLTGSVSGNAMNFTFIMPTDEDHDDPTELIDTIVTARLRRNDTVAVSSLWPPNHAMVDVGLGIAATDTFTVYSDEDNGRSIDTAGSLFLRAERAGSGDGRVYLIAIESGHASPRCLTVVVPKSQSAADIASVNAQATDALAQCPSPSGFFVID